MKLKEQGEHVETFRILPSRFEMKSRHPFRREEDPATSSASHAGRSEPPRPPLTPEELAALEEHIESVESPAVRAALARAIRADTKRR